MTDERLETQGHGHKVRTQKVIGGKPRIFLVEGCKRCEEIKAQREGKEKGSQRAVRLHPDADISEHLQALKDNKDCKVIKSKNETFYDITAPDGGNIRISTGKMNKKQKEAFATWLSEHNL